MKDESNERPLQLVISCEHAGNEVPSAYRNLFRGASKVLESHRGYDPCSLDVGRYFSRKFDEPLFVTKVSRLLVEVNRSIGHSSLFSEWSSILGEADRRKLIETYYEPHRSSVESRIRDEIRRKSRVVHVSMHTFTPVLHGETRRADVGLLYDPSRPGEKRFCSRWGAALADSRRDLVVRKNYPYRGAADGFTTALRKRHADRDYLGIELELNQKWVGRSDRWKALIQDVAQAFATACSQF